MDMIHDGASRQRLKTLPKLAIHGSAGLAAIVCAGLVGHFMMGSGEPRAASTTPPATAQIYEVPDLDPAEAAPVVSSTTDAAAGTPAAAPQPVAAAPIPPKPVAKPAVKAAARNCDGGKCESWESIVDKALANGSSGPRRAAPMPASAPGGTPRLDPYQTGAVAPVDDVMPPPVMGRNIPPQDVAPRDLTAQYEPRVIEREGPTSIGDMAKSATTSAAATVVTQSSKLVDNLMRWSENAVSGVGLKRD